MNKASLRKLYTEKRKELTTGQTEALSAAILQQLKALSIFQKVKYVHIFYPITGKKEIDTLLIVEWLRKDFPEIKLVLPRSNLENSTLEHILWTEETRLAINRWGITEPEFGELVHPQQLDLVLMPLLAFDRKGNRLGYGKGFYDRFLTECRKDALKAGLSYFGPEEHFSEVDVNDIPLDICITPTEVFRFNAS